VEQFTGYSAIDDSAMDSLVTFESNLFTAQKS